MASNILSRLLPSVSDDEDAAAAMPKRRERFGDDIEALAADDLESGPQFEDQDLEALLAEGMEDELSPPSVRGGPSTAVTGRRPEFPPTPSRAPNAIETTSDEDDDVPESLLLEGRAEQRRGKRRDRPVPDDHTTAAPLPGPETRRARLQWETTQAQQRLHTEAPRRQRQPTKKKARTQQGFVVDPRHRAMWMWANVENLDAFLRDVYFYYEEHGIWSIITARSISVLTAVFMYWLSTFMFFCIDYSKLPGSTSLEQVRVPHCTKNLPGYWNFFSWVFIFGLCFMVFRYVQDLPRHWEMHNFYHHLLDIPDKDIQTISWQYVVSKLMELRDANPSTATNISAANRRFLQTQSKQRMDAHDIANRLMRRENYWIALINKDILDCNVNIPFLGKLKFYTRSLQWNISLCLMDFVFDEDGQVNASFRSSKRRQELVDTLRKRFWTAGLLNIFLSLPMAIWSMALRFLTSFTEYQKNPGSLSTRAFSLHAEWKIRDFNEVNHLFSRRKSRVNPYAIAYLDQFPKDKVDQAARFAAFIVGALAAVLGVLTLWDAELFLGFEIAGRTALFWIGIFGTLYITFKNSASNEEEGMWDPEEAMELLVQQTHYCPDSWKGKLHSDEVRKDFASMYKLEVILFLEDVLGVIFTPLILMYSLPSCADQLVDFFREFTIHVDGLGTVCSYAVFDFRNGGKPKQRAGDIREDYYADKASKLEKSFASFMDIYGPNPKRGGLSRRKQRFHPPPTFPGLMSSPSVLAEHTSQRHPPGMRQSIQQTPRLNPAAASHASPMHSILLDSHHQPRASPQHGPSSARRHRALDNDVREEDEDLHDDVAASRPGVPRTSSNLLDDDSELGESWLLKGDDAAQDDDGGARRGQEGAVGEPAVGVLGMLMELQKAKTEARGGHI